MLFLGYSRLSNLGFSRSGILWYMGFGWSLSSRSSEGSVVRVTAADSLQVRQARSTISSGAGKIFVLRPRSWKTWHLEVSKTYCTSSQRLFYLWTISILFGLKSKHIFSQGSTIQIGRGHENKRGYGKQEYPFSSKLLFMSICCEKLTLGHVITCKKITDTFKDYIGVLSFKARLQMH